MELFFHVRCCTSVEYIHSSFIPNSDGQTGSGKTWTMRGEFFL